MQKTYRPLPRLHRRLYNIGLSAAGAADVLASYRSRHDYPQDSHPALAELIRAAFQNRKSLAAPLPGSAPYRSQHWPDRYELRFTNKGG